MENAVEALKMAFAMFIFCLALTVCIVSINQAKKTADTVFSYKDKNTKYVDNLENITYTTSTKENRTVSLETIIPTVYRYPKEGFGVTIIDKQGKVAARFDVEADSMINKWAQLKLKYNNSIGDKKYTTNYYKYLNYLSENIYVNEDGVRKGFADINSNMNSIENDLLDLFKLDPNGGLTYGAPWAGNTSDIVRRINADFGGTQYYKEDGVAPGKVSYQNGFKVYNGLGLESRFKNSTFTE